MNQVALTPKRLLQVTWAFTWRWFIATIGGGIIIVWLANKTGLGEGVPIYLKLLGFIIYYVFTFHFIIKSLLGKSFGDIKVCAVSDAANTERPIEVKTSNKQIFRLTGVFIWRWLLLGIIGVSIMDYLKYGEGRGAEDKLIVLVLYNISIFYVLIKHAINRKFGQIKVIIVPSKE